MEPDPFIITEPTVISFSGGRTSAHLLWRVLQSNSGLPEEAIVCFANTGKEKRLLFGSLIGAVKSGV
jgi:hypothetical protein